MPLSYIQRRGEKTLASNSLPEKKWSKERSSKSYYHIATFATIAQLLQMVEAVASIGGPERLQEELKT